MKQEFGTLTKTAALFIAANIGSKALKLLIIPMYTYYMSTSQFGTAETVSVTASLLCPVLLLGTNEAAIRFSMDRIHNTEDTASNCFVILFASTILALPMFIVLARNAVFEGRVILLFFIVALGALEALMMSLAKGSGKNLVFALSEIVSAITLVLSNIITLMLFKAGTDGYLWSMVAASAARVVFIESRIRIFKTFRWKSISLSNIREILKFSLPLMPNALLWWIMDSSDRYIILWMLGTSSVGVYAVACRLFSAFTGIAFVLHQAWQLSAIKMFFSEEYNTFYKNVSDVFASILFAAAAIITPFVRPLINILDESYVDAWKFAPLLLTAAVLAGLSGFAGVNYTASGSTKGALTSTLAGSTANIVLNVILVRIIGVQGAVIATVIAYYVLWLLRMLDVRRQLGEAYSFTLIHVNLIMLIAESACVLLHLEWYMTALCLFILAYINRKSFFTILSLITKII